MLSKTNIPFEYMKLKGTLNPSVGNIYIRGLDGRFYLTEEWNSKYGVDCVVYHVGIILGIAINDVGSLSWTPTNIDWQYDIPDLLNYSTASDAMNDYNGMGNTEAIISAFGSNGNYAALACRNYKFPNGQSGHLPSARESYYISGLSSISEALIKAGGNRLSGSQWTSTESNYLYAFSGGVTLVHYHKNSILPVRPICRL